MSAPSKLYVEHEPCPLCGATETEGYRTTMAGEYPFAWHIDQMHAGAKIVGYWCVCGAKFDEIEELDKHLRDVGYEHLEEHAILGALNR